MHVHLLHIVQVPQHSRSDTKILGRARLAHGHASVSSTLQTLTSQQAEQEQLGQR